MTLEKFLKPNQKNLFKLLLKMYGENVAASTPDNFILVRGVAPIMLVAHMDTVHQEPVKVICRSSDKNILMSPEGIGGDDRCGIYALCKVYETAPVKPWLLFTCDEETGGGGATRFCKEHGWGNLPSELDHLKCLVEIDRKGSEDAVYYDCQNRDFEEYISEKGFVTAYGTFTDICYVAPELQVAAVNLSSGYYNAHRPHEYINRAELENTITKVTEIVADAASNSMPRFDFF
ncbi:MAG: hypothetical protein K6G55_00700 [Selenomonadaceae bacterium]|nr:hypothetical protein [Selenomonadaceae bacterium]